MSFYLKISTKNGYQQNVLFFTFDNVQTKLAFRSTKGENLSPESYYFQTKNHCEFYTVRKRCFVFHYIPYLAMNLQLLCIICLKTNLSETDNPIFKRHYVNIISMYLQI